MYNILIATSQDTSLFFPLRSFLLPAPTALLRPVADSGLVKSSNLSYTWHSRGSLRCRDSDSKEKVKKETGRIFDRLKIQSNVHSNSQQRFSKDTIYRKIPKISPGAHIFQRPFLRGLFLEGLIFGGAYGKFAFQNRMGYPFIWE